MAELVGQLVIPLNYATNDDWDSLDQREADAIAEYIEDLPKGEMIGKTVKYQIADGYAVYIVISEEPLMLIHVNSGDGYQIPDAHMRGLILSDIKEEVRREETLTKMFS